jgi:hypothetical protein
MIDLLNKPVHDALKRNTVRIFQYIDVKQKLHPKLIDASFRLIQSKKEAIAVRCFSMVILAKMCQKYPELTKELRAAIIPIREDSSAGMKAAIRKIEKILSAQKVKLPNKG